MARKTTSTTQKIMAYMERNPDAKPAHIAKALKVPVVRVYSVRTKVNKQEVKADLLSFEQLNSMYKRVEDSRAVTAPVKKSFWAKVVGWFK